MLDPPGYLLVLLLNTCSKPRIFLRGINLQSTRLPNMSKAFSRLEGKASHKTEISTLSSINLATLRWAGLTEQTYRSHLLLLSIRYHNTGCGITQDPYPVRF